MHQLCSDMAQSLGAPALTWPSLAIADTSNENPAVSPAPATLKGLSQSAVPKSTSSLIFSDEPDDCQQLNLPQMPLAPPCLIAQVAIPTLCKLKGLFARPAPGNDLAPRLDLPGASPAHQEDQEGKAARGRKLFCNALKITGIKHITDNILGGVLTSIPLPFGGDMCLYVCVCAVWLA